MKEVKHYEVICPYCGKPAMLVDSIVIYKKRSYGNAYLCKACNAYVGCHPGTDKPLGRLADAELRKWKERAHNAFDILWKKRIFFRNDAYKWLAEELNIPLHLCHIGMFDIEQCQETIDVTLKFLREHAQQN